jgi:arylsulfatase A-like enzyme
VSVTTTRRRFLQASAAAATSAVLGDIGAFAQRPDRPNIILVIVDSLRSDAVYERGIRTPNMDELTRLGLRFTRAYPEAMPTVPARNSILSGRRGFPFRGWHDYRGLLESPGWAPLRHVDQALTSELTRAGYWTAYVTDNPFLGFSSPYEPVRQSVHRFVRTGGQVGGKQPVSSVPEHVLRHWLHPAIRNAKTRRRVGLYLANSRSWESADNSFAGRVFSDAVRVLDDAARQRPFALVVDTYEPHEPWTPPERWLRLYDDKQWHGPEPATLRYGRAAAWLDPGERAAVLRRLRSLYAAEVTMTDHWLGVLLDRLHALNLERETAIVLVADHGILLGEHGWTGKVQTALYPALTRVPLIVVDPQHRHAGRASHWFASTHDVAPTVLGMTGVGAPEAMTGVDLSRVMRGRKLPPRHYAYGGYSDSFYIRSDRWALWAFNKPGEFRLFDLKHDPGYHENVAHRHPGVVRELYGKVLERAGGRLPWYGGP